MSALLKAPEQTAKCSARTDPPLVQHLDLLATAPDGVARLRRLILSLAVQGKLVPQDPRDEPASVLFAKIQLAKEALIEGGKIKPSKELPSIPGDERPFDLPDGWKWVRLGEVCSYIQRGKGPTYADFSAHRVISQKCVRWHGLDLEPARFIEPKSLLRYEAVRFLQDGDLLWNSTGTGTIGRACLIPAGLSGAKLVADSHVTVVRPLLLNGEFLRRWIQSTYVQEKIEGSASGTTNQIELNTSTVIAHVLPLPPFSEQARIVTRVEELMRLCDALEAKGRLEAEQHSQIVTTLLGTLTDSESPEALAGRWQRIAAHFDILLDRPEAVDALEQTVFQLAVRGLLVQQDEADQSVTVRPGFSDPMRLFGRQLENLPRGWKPASLSTIGRWAIGSGFPVEAQGQADLPILFAKVSDMNLPGNELEIRKTNHTVDAELASKLRATVHPPGTVIFPKIGGAIATNKRRILVKPTAIDNNCLGITPSNEVTTKYLYLILRSIDFASYQAGTSVPALSQATLGKISMGVPPLAEQARIVTRAEELLCLCTDLRGRLAAAQATQAQLAEALVAQPAS